MDSHDSLSEGSLLVKCSFSPVQNDSGSDCTIVRLVPSSRSILPFGLHGERVSAGREVALSGFAFTAVSGRGALLPDSISCSTLQRHTRSRLCREIAASVASPLRSCAARNLIVEQVVVCVGHSVHRHVERLRDIDGVHGLFVAISGSGDHIEASCLHG